MRRDSQIVSPDDTRAFRGGYGIPTKCFYCPSPIGTEHAADCVCRVRTVVVKMAVEWTVEVPDSWDVHDIEFHRNESSWCADNALHELEEISNKRGCICGLNTVIEYVREATKEDEEASRVYQPPEEIAP